jgi:hypothetical protein
MNSIYKKLQISRVKLQCLELKKTGKNTFSKYEYFELGDYLPQIQSIFNEIGLCGIISFTDDLATLSIYDTEIDNDSDPIILTSPMAGADLKGCHPVQNLGATQTYLRRYLWQSALEIVEHDALDAVTGKEKIPEPVNYAAAIEAVTSRDQLNKVWKSIPTDSRTPELIGLGAKIGSRLDSIDTKDTKK